jgi:ssDNA-binding Zn-finger/Zn-ribbon topoisomerase 1
VATANVRTSLMVGPTLYGQVGGCANWHNREGSEWEETRTEQSEQDARWVCEECFKGREMRMKMRRRGDEDRW